jgi:hypothetical protein
LPESLEELHQKGVKELMAAFEAYNIAANSRYGAASYMVVAAEVAEELDRLREELNNK